MIHAGDAGDDDWFASLGESLADLLDEAGVPRCQGGVMAANPQWRGTAAGWRERVDDWLRRAAPQDLLNVDIFFDLAPVAGEAALAHELHEYAVQLAASTRAFIGLLAESVNGCAPRLGMFGRLHVEQGRLDLKRDGLLALVMVARTLALKVGSTARSTPERLRDAADAGRMSENEARELIELQRLLLTWILRQQLADLEDGARLSTTVPIRALTRAERKLLAHSLRTLATIAGNLRSAVASG